MLTLARRGGAVLLLVAAIGCAATAPRSPEARPTRLDPSLDALAAWFDAHAGRPRALALLSPT
ncbi:MAG: hypothetical protein ACYTG2_13345 [Planctomycetota bacterium]